LGAGAGTLPAGEAVLDLELSIGSEWGPLIGVQ
jgi:hypothetical protein